MTPLEILAIDAKYHYKDTSWEDALEAYEQAVDNPNVRILQYGNSFMSVHASGEFHFVNAAPPQEFIKNVVAIMGMAKGLGYTKLHTDFTNPKIIEVAKHTGLDWEVIPQEGHYIMNVRL